MESNSENYKKRCIKRLKAWNAPVSGWECINMYDIVAEKDDDDAALATCELCGCTQVRFVHVMQHQCYFENLEVGCVCSGIMDGDILAAIERERLMKNRMARRKRFVKRQWQYEPNGTYTLWHKHHRIMINLTRFGFEEYTVVCQDHRVNHYKGKRITSFLSAIYAAFDLVDPPIRGIEK